MTTERKFAAFAPDEEPPRMGNMPEGGLCLSAFLVLSKRGRPQKILMGQIDPSYRWDHIGALDLGRAKRTAKEGWMLPSSQLLIGESPEEAILRILREQLGLRTQPLEGPFSFSEEYSRGKGWDIAPLKHWDLEFVFLGERDSVKPHPAWRELKFVDLRKVDRQKIARSHEDILAHVGRWPPTHGAD